MPIFAGPLKVNQNQIQNAVIHVLATAPTGAVSGQIYWDSSSLGLRVYDGTSWALKSTDSSNLNGQSAPFYLNRTNHTGTQTSSTISDLSTTVQAYPLNSFSAPTSNVAMNGFTLTGLNVNPSSAGNAAEYSWVLNQISTAVGNGVRGIKDPVRVLFPSNMTLAGIPATGTADGVNLITADRVLLTGQTTGSQNGIWVISTGSWVRPSDFNDNSDITGGTEVLVNEGLTYAGSVWRITNTSSIVLGTTALTYSQVSKATTYTAGNGLLLTGTVFSAVPASGGGLTVGPSGIAVDRTTTPNRFGATIGDGSTTSFTITHNLGTQDVVVSVREITTNSVIYPDIAFNTINTITVNFTGYVPANTNVRVVVLG